MEAARDALKETRSTLRRIGVSTALAVAIGLLIIGTFGLLIALPAAAQSGWLHWLVAVLRWPLVPVLVTLIPLSVLVAWIRRA